MNSYFQIQIVHYSSKISKVIVGPRPKVKGLSMDKTVY